MKTCSICLSLVVILISLFMIEGCSQKKNVALNSKATMRPYKVLGRHYAPRNVNLGQMMHGISSWYGPDFHGKLTSNGEVYNMYARTAAHKTWPMNTMVRVKNIENGKSTVVRINDRGPFVKGRVIDCSYLAGKELGLDKMGIAKVELQVIGCEGKINSKSRTHKQRKNNNIKRLLTKDFGIQLGAFSSYAGAKQVEYISNKKYKQYASTIERYNTDNGILYRVLLFGFKSKEDAVAFKKSNILTGQVYSREIG